MKHSLSPVLVTVVSSSPPTVGRGTQSKMQKESKLKTGLELSGVTE